MEDLRVLIFLHMLGAFLAGTATLRLFGQNLSSKTLATYGVFYGLIIWLVRGLYNLNHIPLGTHTLILAGLGIILMRLITKVDWNTAVGAILISFSLIMLGSGISQLTIMYLVMDPAVIFGNPWYHVLAGHLENILFVIFLIVNKLFGFTFARSLGRRY